MKTNFYRIIFCPSVTVGYYRIYGFHSFIHLFKLWFLNLIIQITGPRGKSYPNIRKIMQFTVVQSNWSQVFKQETESQKYSSNNIFLKNKTWIVLSRSQLLNNDRMRVDSMIIPILQTKKVGQRKMNLLGADSGRVGILVLTAYLQTLLLSMRFSLLSLEERLGLTSRDSEWNGIRVADACH